MRKLYVTIFFVLFSNRLSAQDSLIILGTENPLSDVIVKIDLLRVCSSPTDNIPNHYFVIDGNKIDLRVSIDYSSIFICDPLPPWLNNYLNANLGKLPSGEYELNIFFVDSDEDVITGTPFQLGPFVESVFFQVEELKIIPVLSMISLLLMMLILLITGVFRLNKHGKLTNK